LSLVKRCELIVTDKISLISVILAGGAGTRLWPASRSSYPKPFMCVGSPHSLLELTIQRGLACGAQETMVVANAAYQFKIAESVAATVPAGARTRLLMEPAGRNTAPAIAAAALDSVKRHGKHAIMLVLAADHMIHDVTAFKTYVDRADGVWHSPHTPRNRLRLS
jgi:mannose-1-phosphate guanylyltransferase / mannose-6-phosphate isomerase